MNQIKSKESVWITNGFICRTGTANVFDQGAASIFYPPTLFNFSQVKVILFNLSIRKRNFCLMYCTKDGQLFNLILFLRDH